MSKYILDFTTALIGIVVIWNSLMYSKENLIVGLTFVFLGLTATTYGALGVLNEFGLSKEEKERGKK